MDGHVGSSKSQQPRHKIVLKGRGPGIPNQLTNMHVHVYMYVHAYIGYKRTHAHTLSIEPNDGSTPQFTLNPLIKNKARF